VPVESTDKNEQAYPITKIKASARYLPYFINRGIGLEAGSRKQACGEGQLLQALTDNVRRHVEALCKSPVESK
jgi:hypothetical protein